MKLRLALNQSRWFRSRCDRSGSQTRLAARGWPPQPRHRRGFILVAVLILIMLASMVAISLLFRLKAEDTAAAAGAGAEQAWAAAMSGVQEAMRVAAAAKPGSTN